MTLVQLHDSEFRVHEANTRYWERLGALRPSEWSAGFCEESCLIARAVGRRCPYCVSWEDGFHEGPIPASALLHGSPLFVRGAGKQAERHIHLVRDTRPAHPEEKYRLLFEQVQEGVFVATPEGKLLDCNDAFMRMLDTPAAKILMGVNVDTELYASSSSAMYPTPWNSNYVRKISSHLAAQGWNAAERDRRAVFASRTGRKDRALPGFFCSI